MIEHMLRIVVVVLSVGGSLWLAWWAVYGVEVEHTSWRWAFWKRGNMPAAELRDRIEDVMRRAK